MALRHDHCSISARAARDMLRLQERVQECVDVAGRPTCIVVFEVSRKEKAGYVQAHIMKSTASGRVEPCQDWAKHSIHTGRCCACHGGYDTVSACILPEKKVWLLPWFSSCQCSLCAPDF